MSVSQNGTNQQWVVVYTADNAPEAHIVAGRLHSEDIDAWVQQEPAGSALGITVGMLGEVRVLVREQDYDLALDILEGPSAHLSNDNDQIIFDDTDDADHPDDDEYDSDRDSGP